MNILDYSTMSPSTFIVQESFCSVSDYQLLVSHKYLVNLANLLARCGNISELVDPKLNEEY